MIIFSTEESKQLLKDTINKAIDNGSISMLMSKLTYLSAYGNERHHLKTPYETKCEFFPDHYPNSLLFVIKQKASYKDDTLKTVLQGGLVYREDSNTWEIHT